MDKISYKDQARLDNMREVDGLEESERHVAPPTDVNEHIRLFMDTVLSQVFPECKLKAKKQKQMLDLLQNNPKIGKHLAF